MLQNTVVNILSYFYPVGNTPAVYLTEGLAWEQDADVLLLGCGDVRHVLFTLFSDGPKSKWAHDIKLTC